METPHFRPEVLLDRDGTIIVDHGYVASIDRVELSQGVAGAIAALNRADLPVAVLTKQSGVARCFYDINGVEQVHKHIADRLAEQGAHVDLFLYCPYHPGGTVAPFRRRSEDREPRPGYGKCGSPDAQLGLAILMDDRGPARGYGLAETIGACALWVGAGNYSHSGVRSFPSLVEASYFILERVAA